MNLSLREVLIEANASEGLHSFAHSVFLSTGIEKFEQRFSESYVEETYWLGTSNGFGIKIAIADQATSIPLTFSVCVTNKFGIPAQCSEMETRLNVFLENSGRKFSVED